MARGKLRIQVGDKLTTIDRVVICISEICGTAILVFLGCAGCIDFSSGLSPPSHLQICLTFGLAVMVAVQVFGHISGSHINPIVTFAAATLGNIPLVQVPIYFVGQMLGALVGYGLLEVVTEERFLRPKNGTVLGACSPGLPATVSSTQGLFVEFVISFMLVLVCCGVWDYRNSTRHDSVPLRFGLAIAVLALAGGPYTGANMNPARSFAPALFNGDWSDHWVYWVGPLGAGILGALFYKLIFGKEEPQVERASIPEGIPLNDKV